LKRSWRRSLETLRARGYRRGFFTVGDAELIALVLASVNHRSPGAIAQELIDRFGGLAGVGNAEIDELTEVHGIGSAGALRLKASFELGRRSVIALKELDIRTVKSPEDVAELMMPEMRELDREHFKTILLNTKNGILKIVTVAVGSLNAALVHPREIFKAAVTASAAGIILVHNHPTGDPEPSREDEQLTERFARCGELMGIDLVDHIIIGGNCFCSMRERGLVDV
jgi:DNA repair protein RadC